MHHSSHEAPRAHTDRGDHEEDTQDRADRAETKVLAEQHRIDRHRPAVAQAEQHRPGIKRRRGPGLDEQRNHDRLEPQKAGHCPLGANPVGQQTVGNFADHAEDGHGCHHLSGYRGGQPSIRHMAHAVQQNTRVAHAAADDHEIQRPKGARPHRLAQAHTRQPGRGRRRSGWVEPPRLGLLTSPIVTHEQGQRNDEQGDQTQPDIGAPPAIGGQQENRQRGKDRRTHVLGLGNGQGQPLIAHKPFRDQRGERHAGGRATSRNEHAKKEVQMPQGLDLAHQKGAEDEDQPAADHHPSRAEAVAQHAAQQTRHAKAQPVDHGGNRDRAPVPGKLGDNRLEHDAKGFNHPVHDQAQHQAGKNNHPAVENPSRFACRLLQRYGLFHPSPFIASAPRIAAGWAKR